MQFEQQDNGKQTESAGEIATADNLSFFARFLLAFRCSLLAAVFSRHMPSLSRPLVRQMQ